MPVPGSRGMVTKWARPLARVLAGGLALFFAVGLPGPSGAVGELSSVVPTPAPDSAPESTPHPRDRTYLKRRWGVEVMDVRQTAAGHMLEFRYKVLDPDRAKPLFERRTKPVLTHVETGAKLQVPVPPTTGALRNSNPPIAGRVYWMFFSNPGGLVRPGDHVSVEIGEFRVDDLIVR